LSSCAVRHAPQINKETQWKLNTVAQLNTLQKEYTTFFKDVGDAQKANTLSEADVTNLNQFGHPLRTAIQDANKAWVAYVAAPSDDKKQQIVNLILVAEELLLNLTTKRAELITMHTGGIQ